VNILKSPSLLLGTFLIPAIALASGTYSDNCPGGGAVNVAFPDPNAFPGTCIIGFAAAPNGPPGTATPTIVNTTAGVDFFNNGIGMVYDTSSFDQGENGGYTFSVDTNPTWDKNAPLFVPTFLGLTGSVQIPDQTGSITITVIGLLGGDVFGFPQIISITLNHADCAQCTLSIPDFGEQLQSNTASETIVISSVGRVVYRTDDPIFDGEVPEPGTVGLLLGGLGAVFIGHRKRKR
jgi:hypothetical protein